MNISNTKITKILSSYHLRVDRSVPDSDVTLAVKCDCGWVYGNSHKANLKREWFCDPGYLSGLLLSKVRPCHCPNCMRSDDWVHELSYLRSHIEAICEKCGIRDYTWDEGNHTIAGFFTSKIYEEDKPVYIKWMRATPYRGYVQALIAMNNWDAKNGCQREPIKRRIVASPSTNSLLSALMGIRGDMHTPISYSAEIMDTEGVEALGAECAEAFGREYIYRTPENRRSFAALNKRDEQAVRNNGVWWASMFEPDDVVRQMKTKQAEYLRECGYDCGIE